MARLPNFTIFSMILSIFSLFLPVTLAAVVQRRGNAYAPNPASCPNAALVRPASGLSSAETNWISNRKAKADIALAAWLKKVNPSFATSNLPILGLSVSGGGYRSFLSGAGLIQAFDSRDSNCGTSGLYQAISYQSGLSGGSWLLSSLAGNNWATVSSLRDSLWANGFDATLVFPGGVGLQTMLNFALIAGNLAAKEAAGFRNTITDAWGRLLSYQLIKGSNAGAGTTLSSVTSLSNFASYSFPYPIITALGVQLAEGECRPLPNGSQYEFHPFEYGSWDTGIGAFAQTAFMGSKLSNGVPVQSGSCTQNYDNLGYIFGTSSSLFNAACLNTSQMPAGIFQTLQPIVTAMHAETNRDLYAPYPNPFKNYAQSPLVSAQDELTLIDGGETKQNNPVWPFIQSARSVGVLIVNDNSGNTPDNYPDVSELYNTYVQAQADGLIKMPVIPTPATFAAQNLTGRATFFGCDDSNAITIIYMPNKQYTYNTGFSTEKPQYTKTETSATIVNGNNIATQGGDAGWPVCLGCAIMKKTNATLPAQCGACFQKYCYSQY